MSVEKTPDPCGCCEVATPPTPEEIANRSGLPAIRYRLGTYATFRQAMIEAIAHNPLLREWSVRDDDDYGIALVDMWAYVGDILTFYQERFANEAFLRTAVLRESVIRIAALLDYRPNPGVAATAYLAFALEKDKQANIPTGLRVQSVPAQNQKPQKFETVETINATARLNQVRVMPEPNDVFPLQPGDREALLEPSAAARIADAVAPGDSFVIFDETAPVVDEKEITALRAETEGVHLGWAPPLRNAWGTRTRSFRFRRKLAIFGYNAPDSFVSSTPDSTAPSGVRWTLVASRNATDWNVSGSSFNLDGRYDDLKAETRLVFFYRTATSAETRLVKIRTVSQAQDISMPPLADTVTRITLDQTLPAFDRRTVVIYELMEPEIEFWNLRFPAQISGNMITTRLQDLRPGQLPIGRRLILADDTGKTQLVRVQAALNHDYDGDGVTDHLRIRFSPALTANLDAGSARLYGNVVKATHGETIANEVLGNGDASAAFQSFTLKKKPITFVPQASAPNGAMNSLQVRVSGVLWKEKPVLLGSSEDDEVYRTSIADDDTMIVQFGDGVTGARVPTGRSNIVATYRQGVGRVGNVNANALTTLLDRPLGVKGVTNPDLAAGGAEPETLQASRDNAPNTVRTFGRIVSLRDFEDAAREFAGVAKARATWEWSVDEMAVRLVVAGDNGAPVGNEVMHNLRQYLDARRDPNRKLLVEGFTRVPVSVEAVIRVDPRFVAAEVRVAALLALRDYFSFENLDLGQSIHLSGVYAVLKSVPGVLAADVDRLNFKAIASMTIPDLRRRGVKFFVIGSLVIPKQVQGHLLLLPNEIAFIESAPDVVVSVGILA
jgi:uncharacterized phage protein gp47/JayE